MRHLSSHRKSPLERFDSLLDPNIDDQLTEEQLQQKVKILEEEIERLKKEANALPEIPKDQWGEEEQMQLNTVLGQIEKLELAKKVSEGVLKELEETSELPRKTD